MLNIGKVSIYPICLILTKFNKHTDSYSDKRNDYIIFIPYEARYRESKYNYDLLNLYFTTIRLKTTSKQINII